MHEQAVREVSETLSRLRRFRDQLNCDITRLEDDLAGIDIDSEGCCGELSMAEQLHVREAMNALVRHHGTPAKVAHALGLSVEAMWKARSPSRSPGRRLAHRVALAAGVPVVDVLAGTWPRACKTCGKR